ncbi:MAG: hypothetical protein D6806_04690 [Deltaproteobacteria bacterium]|nr:MAG: hypothetical protein D6806_04690 [Deltaproteobacteria bacterium]
MKVVAIVQARMGSSRLPGKVLLELGGKTVIEQVVSRLRRASSLDDVVVAIPIGRRDDPLEAECSRIGAETIRGPEDDVLARYILAARATGADIVVRITSDCPCTDPDIVDLVMHRAISTCCDYASNTLQRSWPRGYDVEVVRTDALERAAARAVHEHEKEHVTPAIWQNPHLYSIEQVTAIPQAGNPDWRLCLDTPLDYAMLKMLWKVCADGEGKLPGAKEVIACLQKNPWLVAMNSGVRQKSLPDPVVAMEAVG